MIAQRDDVAPPLPLDTILCGDALDVLRSLPDACCDAIVTDPPYGLGAAPDMLDVLRAWLAGEAYQPRGRGGFMGKAWDAFVPGPEYWRECLRVLKPGGHALVFAGTRTWDVMGLALRLAGFELRDTCQWLYGSGFPKSLDVGKAIDRRRQDDVYHVTAFLAAARDAAGLKNRDIDAHFSKNGMAGHWTSSKSQPEIPTWEQWQQLRTLLDFSDAMDAEVWRLNGRKGQPGDAWYEREVVGVKERKGKPPQYMWGDDDGQHWDETRAATDAARAWDGWGTALKPAWEPIIVCRKPLSEPTVAANVLRWGTGALNIGQSRVGSEAGLQRPERPGKGVSGGWADYSQAPGMYGTPDGAGRWPANLLLSHADDCLPDHCSLWCPVREMDRQSGALHARGNVGPTKHGETALFGNGASGHVGSGYARDGGGASRFFPTFRYIPKASRAERNRGCDGLPASNPLDYIGSGVDGRGRVYTTTPRSNSHPTVKPLALMSWLITLITPPAGIVLDPFAGSGSTLCAAKAGGWRYIGVEREAEYVAIAEARLEATL